MLESEFYQVYKDQGFVVLQPMGHMQGEPVTDAQLLAWIDSYGLTFPVLNDQNWTVFSRYRITNYVPFNMVLDRCMKIDYKANYFSKWVLKSRIETLLEQEIPE